MEKTTINTYLMHSTTESGNYEILVDITSYPELFSPPERIDISTMSSSQKKYTKGMVDVPEQEFGYIYSKDTFDKIKKLEGKKEFYQLRFGEKGEFGAWQWQGDVFTSFSGGSVGGVREAKVITYPETDIKEVTIGG